MAIKFNIHEMGNPSDQDAPKKFYARAVHSGEVTLDELSADISNSSSINESDVYAVLRSLAREIPRQIALGNIVRIEPLGSFYLGCNSS